MKQLKLRFGKPEEAEEIVAWINNNPNNGFDPEILQYPTLQVLCAYSPEGVIAYLPKHIVTMLESTAINPNCSPLESAQALRSCVQGAILLSSGQNIKEIYFIVTDAKLEKIAENNGFEKLPWPVMRMKI